MSPRRCAVDGCKSVSGQQQHQGVKFHTFPINLPTRKIWIENCRIAKSRNITKSVLVCSRHFRRADFMPLKNNKHFLKNGAVPTIFPWGNLPYHEVGNGTTTTKSKSTESRVEKETDESKAVSSTSETTKKQSVRQKSLGNVDVNVKHRSASAEEKNNENRSLAGKLNTRKSLDSATLSAIKEEKVSQSIDATKPADDSSTELIASLVSGAKLEAQDFSGSWHIANVVEVDHGEQEVLINFEKTSESKGPPLIDEWISMNSKRLRVMEKQKPVAQQFVQGERCLARWTDSRKFPATVQKVLDNNMFEVLFDDGFPKTVKASHMSKLKRSVSEKIAPVTPIPVVKKTIKTTQPIPKFDLSRFNLPEIPIDGEWCCPWVNDTPIGQEGFLTNADGNKRPTVLVEDWRLPKEWTKHLYQRSSVSGKWDVVLVGPNNKRFRSKNDVKVYLEGHGQSYNPDVYDFSIHKRRAKDIGVYVYTDDYVPPVVPKPSSEFKRDVSFPSSSPNVTSDLFPGFSPEASITSVETLNATKDILNTPTTSAALIPENPLEAGYIYVGALKVQIIDNLFRCPKEGCNKNFRKENHLQIHVKHYHDELSKQLGACPNMTDLAYFRTMGTAVDETPSKNQIANTQYFEKAYQSTTPAKALPPIPADIKSEIVPKEEIQHTPIPVETPKRKSSELHLSDVDDGRRSTDLDSISEVVTSLNDLPMNTLTPIVKQEAVPAAPAAEKVVSKAPVHRFKIGKLAKGGKAGRKKGSKNFRYRKLNRGMKKQLSDALTSNPVNESLEFTETPRSLVGAVKASERIAVSRPKYNRKKFHPYSLFKEGRLDKGGSVVATTMPRYINENGKMIKIVHMRQEEIINCLCSYGEEDGLMIQCELCLCWQHGGCNGIEKESEVPDKYVCYICRNPTRGRESMKYIHDQDWLYDGKLYQATYHEPNTALIRQFELLKQSHTLTGNLLDLKRSLHSLNVKINIAANKDHPKLYLWSSKWENDPRKMKQGHFKRDEATADTKKMLTIDDKTKSNENNDPNQLPSAPKAQEKTNADECHLPSVTRKDVEEDNSILSNLLSSPESNKNSSSNTFDNNCPAIVNPLPKLEECPPIDSKPDFPNIPEPEAAINPLDCQRKLLEHIQREQSTILSRMKTIDAQIIALEMDNHTDTYADPNFLKTNQTIHMLLNDLSKLRKMIDISQTLTVNAVE